MTQVKHRDCHLDQFAPRPELTPLFHGDVGRVPRLPKWCLLDDEKPRREDGLRPHFGSGVPTMGTADVDIAGLAVATEPLAYSRVQTSEGSLKIPLEREHMQYLPSASTLDFLTHSQGTRLQPLPTRYFTR